jgi:hypothetical protein
LPDISALNGTAVINVREFDGLTVSDPVINPDAATSGFLFTYSGASVAYSVRQLNNNAPYVLRVRRQTGASNPGNDDEADVKFDTTLTPAAISLDSPVNNFSANGSNATTLGEFLNVGTVNSITYTDADSLSPNTAEAYVDAWYDLTGNQDHAEQATPVNQPKIHSGFANTDLITENGKPGIEFTAAENMVFTSTDIYSFFIVSRPTTLNTGSTNFAVGLSTALKGVVVAGDSSSRQARAQTNTGTLNITGIGVSTAQSLVDYVTTGTTGKLRYNGANEVTGSATQITVDQIGTADTSNFRVLNGPLQEIIMWPTDQDSNRTGIEQNINSEFLIYQPTDAPTSGLLATYTGAAAAYSVRQLSDKAILCMRIRRDMGAGNPGDDDEINIGFDANGDLDTQAIADFCGTGTGYVTRWWDQSTNGNHADQPVGGTGSNINQPQIYNGTAVITENGKPALDFQVDRKELDAGSVLDVSSRDIFQWSVYSLQTGAFWNPIINGPLYSGHNQNTYQPRLYAQRVSAQPLGNASSGLTIDQMYLRHDYADTSNARTYLDGDSTPVIDLVDNNSDWSTGDLSIGTVDTTPDTYMKVSEVLLWQTGAGTVPSNRAGIESNVMTYFSIT